MLSTRSRTLLIAILLLYLILAVLFAVYTPPWQAPDEPAHYNYVRYLAEKGQFPVLHMGDYPHAYLEQIKAAGFPAGMSIDPIRYEFHQPPLYYALLAPVYALSQGSLIALRLVSVLLGAGIVLLAYAIGRQVFPERPAVALGAAAFVAFLPQHLATVSQVGNDVLAELLLAAVLLVLVRIGEQRSRGAEEQGSGERRGEGAEERKGGGSGADPHVTDLPICQSPIVSQIKFRDSRSGIEASAGFLGSRAQPAKASIPEDYPNIYSFPLPALGLLLGLILITKTTAYIAAPLAGGVLLWRWWRERAGLRRIVREAAAVALPAALIALPWYVRNISVYGWPDFLGLQRHDAIVIGQTRLADFAAQNGWPAYWQRAVEWTFKSFVGVFGWMGVWLDTRVYFALAVLGGMVLGGGLLRIPYSVSRIPYPVRTSGRAERSQFAIRNSQFAIRLLTLSALLTGLTYAWYNTQFLQHQGRYLFTALIPIALAFAAGWERVVRAGAGRWTAAGLAVFAAGLAAWGTLSGAGLPKWPVAMAMTAAVGAFLLDLALTLLAPHDEQGRGSADRAFNLLRAAASAFPYAFLTLVALYALFGAIVPQLTSIP